MLASFVPADRLAAVAAGVALPAVQNGAALFADIGGFTPLAEALERTLGPQGGAEELATIVNWILDALVAAVSNYGGSIITFSGDAITCWFNTDDGRRAIACGVEMQSAMARVGHIAVPGVALNSVGLKVTIAGGSVRRF